MQYKLAYTVEELLQLLPITRTGLYKAIANNEIRSFRPTRRRFFSHSAVMDYLAYLEKKGAA